MNRENHLIFDSVAQDYQLMRPGYPDQLYQEIFSYCPLSKHSTVAEIGIGSGQATTPFLKTGSRLTAIEPGSKFAQMCMQKFGGYEAFSLLNCRFEEAQLAEESFDLVYSASAFHWIEENSGYEKVFRILKSGGAFARFANHPLPAADDPTLAQDIQKLYETYYYPHFNRKPEAPRRFSKQQAAELAEKAGEHGFIDICHQLFQSKRRLSAVQYTRLLGTYSDHLMLPEAVRREFFLRIEQAVNDHGGRIFIADTIDLEMARKP